MLGRDISIRLDRVDRLPDGSLLIIDYKTGAQLSPTRWFHSTPLDSQLPFYACFANYDAPVCGISYAIVHPNNMGYKGVTAAEYAEQLPLESIEKAGKWQDLTSWTDALSWWREKLGMLLADFAKGIAEVKPDPVARACDYCELHALCRIGDTE